MNNPLTPSRFAPLVAGLLLIFSGRVTAQTFTTLHAFSGPVVSNDAQTNSDGAYPQNVLTLSGNTLYGMAPNGGPLLRGTAFAVNTDGTGFNILHAFSLNTNDADSPNGGWTLSGNTLYGGGGGGANGNGAVFALNTDGTGFRLVHSFAPTGSNGRTNIEGWGPNAVILSGNTLYGTANGGGPHNSGTVFAVNTDGTGFTVLHGFTSVSNDFQPDGSNPQTNSDGSQPGSRLTLSGNTLYGMTQYGGIYGGGTLFAVNTDGSDFTNLYNLFYGLGGGVALTLSGSTLYGRTPNSVFAVNINGTGFTNLCYFSGNSAGNDALTLSGNTLYGTTYTGGTNGDGSVFAVNTNGTSFTTLYSFTTGNGGAYTNKDGAQPEAAPILLGSTLYGTAYEGGANGNGTVFSLSFSAPQLGISHSKTNVNLTWSSIVAGFCGGLALQSATNLASPVAWTTVSNTPVTINGQNFLTNPISSPKQFFRLSQ